MCVSVCEHVPHVCRCLWRPEESARPPGTGRTGGLSCLMLLPGFSSQPVSALNQWIISPAPLIFYFLNTNSTQLWLLCFGLQESFNFFFVFSGLFCLFLTPQTFQYESAHPPSLRTTGRNNTGFVRTREELPHLPKSSAHSTRCLLLAWVLFSFSQGIL